MIPEPSQRALLLSVIAHARAGALDRAWQLYVALDWPDFEVDPVALAVKGRLLKDLALRSAGDERRRLYADAAASYRRAAEFDGATYPLINAATLSLLCGQEGEAHRLARNVLDRIARNPDEPETPYYRAATLAEALLLLGREEEARVALADAMVLAPRAWEDHASTLRQFAIILAAQGGDPAWLDAHRPPRSLHFGGHMAFLADPVTSDTSREVAAVLEAERIGFGYGALAAGADIIVAEALIDRGAVLHVVLPGDVEHFASVSVDPYGAEWRRRFDALLSAAETVRLVEPARGEPDTTMITLADEVAMGNALINARLLASEGIQLLVTPDAGDGPAGASARSRGAWARAGYRQRILHAPREGVQLYGSSVPLAPRHLAAVLAIRSAPAEAEQEQPGLEAIRIILEGCPTPDLAPSFTGKDVVLAYDDVAQAASAAALLAANGVSVGGHYGIGDRLLDPFSGTSRLVGHALDMAHAAATSTPAGTACVTEDFAASLAVAAPDAHRAEYVGELGGIGGEAPIGLYALKALAQPGS